jgi:hypothetical protein
VFNGIHAVLMLHPGASPYWEFIPSHASMRLRAQFSKGRPGIDATAALKLEKAVSRTLARMRHAPYFCRVAPEGQEVGARADMFIAAPSLVELIKVVEPVRRCLTQAAAAAAVSVEISEYRPNAELCEDGQLAAAFRRNAEAPGRSARPKRAFRLNFDTSERNSSGVRCVIPVKWYRWSRWCGTRRSDYSLISRR